MAIGACVLRGFILIEANDLNCRVRSIERRNPDLS
jgi:hypothetical protein